MRDPQVVGGGRGEMCCGQAADETRRTDQHEVEVRWCTHDLILPVLSGYTLTGRVGSRALLHTEGVCDEEA